MVFPAMRSLLLPVLTLSVATFLLSAEISFASPTTPTNHDRHNNLINAQKARSVDTRNANAVTRMAAPNGHNKHLQRRMDMLDPSNQPSLALMQRHNHIMDQLQLYSADSSLAKRSLVGDLTVMGFKLVWDYADIIIDSYIAHFRTTELYRNITIRNGAEMADRTVITYIITYGGLRLVFEALATVAADLAAEMAREFPNGFGEFIAGVAEVMLALTTFAVIVPFAVLAAGVRLSIWITMEIVDNADPPHLIAMGR